MPLSSDIKDWFKSSNRNWGSRIGATLMLIAIAASVYFVYPVVKGGKKESDCTQCQTQLSGVIDFLNLMKKDLAQDNETLSTGFIEKGLAGDFAPAVFPIEDTTPQNKQRILKIDSLLKRIEQIKKSKT